MAPSISSVPIPPAFVFFFSSESCKYLMVGTKDSYEKKKHCETLKCVQIMPYSNDEAKSMFSWKSLKYGRPFVSKLWHDIRAVFSHVYLQSFLLHDIRAFFCHVYLRSFLLCGVFIPKYMTIFLQTRIYMRTKKPIYMRYKQACGICGHRKSSYRKHRIIPSAKNPFMYDSDER